VLTVCWAAKGGSGTTVVSCALALLSARRHETAWLLDLAGDAPAALGMVEPAGPGVHEWVAVSSAPPSAIEAIGVTVADGLRLIGRGSVAAGYDHQRWRELGRFLAEKDSCVVVDAGTGPPPGGLLIAAQQRLLVTRACYLSLRRAASSAVVPSGVIVVHEPGRALRAQDVAYAVRAPVLAEVSVDPSVARAVDAGLLAARMPRTLATALRGLTTSEVSV